MILVNTKKLQVGDIDVYPDHDKTLSQVWYVPGTIRLAERNKRKALSYFWYSDSVSDSDGTGFLNFEVNTAVSEETKAEIKTKVAKEWGIANASLATPTYTGGSVNFSVLGPTGQDMATKAAPDLLTKDRTVVYQSKEQLVWSAGSPSLVGDNSAVCSVKFTKEGKLAAAMKDVIVSGVNSLAALYGLEFPAMRPSIIFEVEGKNEFVKDQFNWAIGASVPLEAVVLDASFSGKFVNLLKKAGVNIKIQRFDDGPQGEGEKLAWKILTDYFLKDLFNVEVAGEKPTPLGDFPPAAKAADKVADVADQKKEEKKDEGDGDNAKAVEEVIKAAVPIPRVEVKLSYDRPQQTNMFNFTYTESRAKTFFVAPQSLVLDGLGDEAARKTYVRTFSRATDPVFSPYPVTVALPTDDDLKNGGLLAMTVQARYPAGASRDRQQAPPAISISPGKTASNSFQFQFDDKGSRGVEYDVDFAFNPNQDWAAAQSQYSYHGQTDSSLINAAVLDFRSIVIQVANDFQWEENNQVVVTLTSKRWPGEKKVVIQKGADKPRVFNTRAGAEMKDEPIHFTYAVQKNNRNSYAMPSQEVVDNMIALSDRFEGRVTLTFKAAFKPGTTSADIRVIYEDSNFEWEDTLESGKTIKCNIPLLKKLSAQQLKDFTVKADVASADSGESIQLDAKNFPSNLVKI